MENYSILTNSLKRLYIAANKVTLEKLQSLLEDSKITQEEFNYITSE